jgi:hypothetical protein
MNTRTETASPQTDVRLSPRNFQWLPALEAGFLAGLVMMIVPRGSPWSALTFFAPVVMGRVIPETAGIPLVMTKAMHLILSIGYGFIISAVVMRITQMRAIIVGAIVGLALYFANWAVIGAAFPELKGDELTVAFTHMVCGGITAGAYRGLLWRRTTPNENP